MSQRGTGERLVSACSGAVHTGNPAVIIAEIERLRVPTSSVVFMGLVQYEALHNHLVAHYEMRKIEQLKKFNGLLVRILPMNGLLVV